MKTFKKLALVSAIAAAPFMAQAELVSMDETLMGQTTGQAGVTIEMELGAGGIDIGSVVYTDEGTVTLEKINVGLTGTITQTIDVNAAGDLEMTMSAPGAISISMGGGDFSALKLGGSNGDSEVINNLSLDVTMGASTTTIMSLGGANGLGLLSAAGIADTTATAYSGQTGSMAIKMGTTVKIENMNVGLFGYTATQADVLGDSVANGGNGDGTVDAGLEQTTSDALTTGSAIAITGLSVTGTAGVSGDMISMDQTIWAKGGTAAQGGGLYIQMGALDASIAIDGIAIGGASIGSVAIKNLSMAGMTQRIYGH